MGLSTKTIVKRTSVVIGVCFVVLLTAIFLFIWYKSTMIPIDTENRFHKVSYSDGFIEHLRSNAPESSRNCIESEVLKRWANLQILEAAANEIRISRGETDVVNFAIRSVQEQCELEKLKHGK